MEECISRAEHEEFARRMEADNKRQDRRLEMLEQSVQQINALASSVEKLAVSVQQMCQEQERQGKRLETLEGRDGELWRKVVSCAVTAIVGGIVGYAISLIVG